MANRQHLYRGKRKDNGEWLEGHLLKYEYGRARIVPSHTDIYCHESNENIIQTIAFEVVPETVCEWTGLEDKNGKKVFEGDYCLIMNPCVMAFGVIKYDNACYWFVADEVRNVIKLCDLEINDFEIQVKSNIHDNPELLEV